MSKLHDRPLLEVPPAQTDLVWVRDVSDTTDSPQGTDKRVTVETLIQSIPGVFHNDNASTDPGPTNDETEGFSIRSIWINQSAGRVWILADATEDNADWRLISSPLVLHESPDESMAWFEVIT